MSTLLSEVEVTCPACWQPHPVTIDLTEEQRSLIEDCTVCCNPMQIHVEHDGHSVHRVEAEAL